MKKWGSIVFTWIKILQIKITKTEENVEQKLKYKLKLVD